MSENGPFNFRECIQKHKNIDHRLDQVDEEVEQLRKWREEATVEKLKLQKVSDNTDFIKKEIDRTNAAVTQLSVDFRAFPKRIGVWMGLPAGAVTAIIGIIVLVKHLT